MAKRIFSYDYYYLFWKIVLIIISTITKLLFTQHQCFNFFLFSWHFQFFLLMQNDHTEFVQETMWTNAVITKFTINYKLLTNVDLNVWKNPSLASISEKLSSTAAPLSVCKYKCWMFWVKKAKKKRQKRQNKQQAN